MVTQSVSPKHVIFLFHRKPYRFIIWSESTIQYETWYCISCKIFTFYLLIAHHNCLLSILTIAYLHCLTPSCCLYLFGSLSLFLFLSFSESLWLVSPWFWLTSLSLKSDSRHISGGITQKTWVKKLTEKDQVSSLIKINSMRLVRKWVIVLVSEWFAIMPLWLILFVFPFFALWFLEMGI